MAKSQIITTVGLLLACGQAANAQWIQWKSAKGGNNHWYRLTAVGSWEEAEAGAVAEGGHLVTINDAAEQGFLNDNFPRLTSEDPPIWIGLFQIPESAEPAGGWVWVSGESVTYTNWHGGEPNDGDAATSEDFAEMHHFAPGSGQGLWNDRVGDAPRPGVIEKIGPPGVTVPAVDTWGLLILVIVVVIASVTILRRRSPASV